MLDAWDLFPYDNQSILQGQSHHCRECRLIEMIGLRDRGGDKYTGWYLVVLYSILCHGSEVT